MAEKFFEGVAVAGGEEPAVVEGVGGAVAGGELVHPFVGSGAFEGADDAAVNGGFLAHNDRGACQGGFGSDRQNTQKHQKNTPKETPKQIAA